MGFVVVRWEDGNGCALADRVYRSRSAAVEAAQLEAAALGEGRWYPTLKQIYFTISKSEFFGSRLTLH